MLPNLHNPMVSVPISLEVLRDAFSEMDDLLRVIKSSIVSLMKRLRRVNGKSECETGIETDIHPYHESVLCKESEMCCDIAHKLQTEIVPAQSRP